MPEGTMTNMRKENIPEPKHFGTDLPSLNH
jgi:hypothetical protein